MWTITLCRSRWLPGMQPEATSTELIVRIATAIIDLDSLTAHIRVVSAIGWRDGIETPADAFQDGLLMWRKISPAR
jgi:hypothetical protein